MIRKTHFYKRLQVLVCAWLLGVCGAGRVGAQVGAITCTLSPSEAVSTGAQWTVYEGGNIEWRSSRAVASNLAVGSHTVTFKSLRGWTAPADQRVEVVADQTNSLSGAYSVDHPSSVLMVNLEPSNAVAGTARWTLTPGSNWMTAGASATNLEATRYTVYFKDVSGWITPYPQIVSLTQGTVRCIGTYQPAHSLALQVFLQGPYQPARGTMSTGWVRHLPLTSPYDDDVRTVTAVPSNVTDWILVQLCRPGSASPEVSRSAFLRKDGVVVDEYGEPAFTVPGSDSAYDIVIKHRNHLAVRSAGAVAFTNSSVAYVFHTNSSCFYGGTNAAVQLGADLWGLIAGDADGDGEVQAADELFYAAQTNQYGWLPADFNADGAATAADFGLYFTNQGRSASALNGGVRLTGGLGLMPALLTAQTNSSHAFTVSGATAPLGCTFTHNLSGGSLQVLNATTLVYQAGGTSDVADVIEVWDASNRLARAQINVIASTNGLAYGKAIIVAGTTGESDPNRPSADGLAQKAYETLLYRGFSPEAIEYLSFGSGAGVDGAASLATVAAAITNWAADAGFLFVYLVDHGSYTPTNAYFHLNTGESVSGLQLDGWLDQLQDGHAVNVSLVIDCCNAGQFAGLLEYEGAAQRLVQASCGVNEAAYFIANGQASFSEAFFNGILLGGDLLAAYQAATNAMAAYQHPQTYAHGTTGAGWYLGPTYLLSIDVPFIGNISGHQTLSGSDSALLWADDIASAHPLARVWGVLLPPGSAPDPSLAVRVAPEVDFSYNVNWGRYEGTARGLSQTGVYTVVFYAQDVLGQLSAPRVSTITQSAFKEKVILVAGGATNLTEWPAIERMGNLVYSTLLGLKMDKASICYLSGNGHGDIDGDGLTDVSGWPTLAQLGNAITNETEDVDQLTVYLIAPETNGACRLTATDTLTAATLDYWLDLFQAADRPVRVIVEMPEAGGFIPALLPPANRERIVITSTDYGQPALWQADGLLSFTACFANYLLLGASIGDAFELARTALFNMSGGQQTALMDDDQDGLPNEKTDPSAQSYLAPVAVPVEGAPVIGRVMAPVWIDQTNSVVLWAADVTDDFGLSNVVCHVTPPDFETTGIVTTVPLTWNGARLRYEAELTGLSHRGTYHLSFQAVNLHGHGSAPVQSFLAGRDLYEPDDQRGQATLFAVGLTQPHNFHAEADEDWAMFYAVSGQVFQIDAEQTGTNIDLALDVYVQGLDGSLQPVSTPIDSHGKGVGQTEQATLDLLGSGALTSGLYFVRVRSAIPNGWGVDSGYDLRVHIPTAGQNLLIVLAVNRLNMQPIPGSVAILNNSESHPFLNTDNISKDLGDSWKAHVHVMVPDGYYSLEDPHSPGQVDNSDNSVYGNPRWSSKSWMYLVFLFHPLVPVDGQILDAVLGSPVDNAMISFTVTSSIVSGEVYTGFPIRTEYGQPWQSGAGGTFPTNLMLPPVSGNLRIERSGYSNLLTVQLFSFSLAPTNLGVFRLHPVDLNGNGLPDAWEAGYFAPGSNVEAGADADADGVNNWQEYVGGTDPANAQSWFGCTTAPTSGAVGVTFTWPVAPGRVYQVQRVAGPLSGTWQEVSAVMTAGVGQTSLQWSDSGAHAVTQSCYRLRILIP